MKNIHKFLMGLFILTVVSCESEEDGPIFYYEDLEGGTYIRLVENGSLLVDLDNVSGYSYSYVVEFVDASGGNSVQSYTLDLVYDDGTTEQTVDNFRVLQASDFSVNDDGFTQASLTITSSELLSAVGITEADLAPEDQFQLAGEIVTGTRTFNSVNSSATVEGAFFVGYFDYTLFVGCPSDLAGEYTATTTSVSCSAGVAGSDVTYTLELDDTGNIAVGEYELSDATFGVAESCFGDGDDDLEAQEGFIFQVVCGVASFTTIADEFGTSWDFSSTVSGEDWVITWSNPDTGQGGVTTVNFPGGVPFTVE